MRPTPIPGAEVWGARSWTAEVGLAIDTTFSTLVAESAIQGRGAKGTTGINASLIPVLGDRVTRVAASSARARLCDFRTLRAAQADTWYTVYETCLSKRGTLTGTDPG
jgi:hypothetical protein